MPTDVSAKRVACQKEIFDPSHSHTPFFNEINKEMIHLICVPAQIYGGTTTASHSQNVNEDDVKVSIEELL